MRDWKRANTSLLAAAGLVAAFSLFPAPTEARDHEGGGYHGGGLRGGGSFRVGSGFRGGAVRGSGAFYGSRSFRGSSGSRFYRGGGFWRDRDDHFGRGFRRGGGVYFSPYLSFGFDPWWWGGYYGLSYPYYPYSYSYGYPYGGYDDLQDALGQAAVKDLGAVEVHVSPKHARVLVDGHFVAEARDLDGSPSYLWLRAGEHKITIEDDGYAPFNEDVNVHRGVLRRLKVHLVPAPEGSDDNS